MPNLSLEKSIHDLVDALIMRYYHKAAKVYLNAIASQLPSDANSETLLATTQKIDSMIDKTLSQDLSPQEIQKIRGTLLTNLLQLIRENKIKSPQLANIATEIVRILPTPTTTRTASPTQAQSAVRAGISQEEQEDLLKRLVELTVKDNEKTGNKKAALKEGANSEPFERFINEDYPSKNASRFFPNLTSNATTFSQSIMFAGLPIPIVQDPTGRLMSKMSKEQKNAIIQGAGATSGSAASQAGSSASHQAAAAAASSSKNAPPTVRRRSSSTDSFSSSDSEQDASASHRRRPSGRRR